mgnify:FL=1
MHTGSMVALVTPMEADGTIAWSSLEDLIEFHIENGTDAIVAVGTTGESATLDVEEHTRVIKFVVEKVNKRVPVLAGTGANSTTEAIHLTRAAKAAGADAALLVTPYYNKPGQEGLYLHYKSIADAVDLPQYLYNVPGRTACDMLPDTIVRLSNHPNIVGVKEATGDIERVSVIKQGAAEGFVILSGDDATLLPFLKAGGHGVISVTANVSPKAMSSLCLAAKAGEWETAERLQNSLMPLHTKLFVEANPIPVKWALNLMGLMPSGIRLPLTELAEENHEVVKHALMESGVL